MNCQSKTHYKMYVIPGLNCGTNASAKCGSSLSPFHFQPKYLSFLHSTLRKLRVSQLPSSPTLPPLSPSTLTTQEPLESLSIRKIAQRR